MLGKGTYESPNNPVFLLSVQVLYLVSEKRYLRTISEVRRLCGLGNFRQKKQPRSSVAQKRQD